MRGAFGELEAEGRKVAMNTRRARRWLQNFRLEVTNPGDAQFPPA